MATTPQDLQGKLDAFVRKYHRNEMLRGALLLCAGPRRLLVIGLETLGRLVLSPDRFVLHLQPVACCHRFLVPGPSVDAVEKGVGP